MFLLERLGRELVHEFYALDFDEQFVLMGHDGPGHVAIADRPTRAACAEARPRKSGRALGRDEGASRPGHDPRPLADRRRALEAGWPPRASAIAGPTFRIGNTNSRIRFERGLGLHGRLVREGPRITSHSVSVTAQATSPRRVAARPELAVVA